MISEESCDTVTEDWSKFHNITAFSVFVIK